ncbi:hypothetical protein CAOG_02800 [Capsaspora owczarzaki ATCC 30864]|uniref:PDZ domain-containing protein n=1 Tax=Capsaspora owczarzaki (strain ATCC 30864) TaxID=595528 RepID=A0A0D2X202_CAPO3|nr:hypothetical protein CAOG_02800 [Capsaspora owczarzaki ATCC 30864]KJE91704.1 hypothetical protein CAOG_002800 [Capsaspora owczarzaki ATCC 30864]|eukprot:XP_004348613.1 hypothetical protein CAOG_02800 [Capsaspora owczarzaki ATCC 30864]
MGLSDWLRARGSNDSSAIKQQYYTTIQGETPSPSAERGGESAERGMRGGGRSLNAGGTVARTTAATTAAAAAAAAGSSGAPPRTTTAALETSNASSSPGSRPMAEAATAAATTTTAAALHLRQRSSSFGSHSHSPAPQQPRLPTRTASTPALNSQHGRPSSAPSSQQQHPLPGSAASSSSSSSPLLVQLSHRHRLEDESAYSDVNAPPKRRQRLIFVFKPDHDRVGMHLARLPLHPAGSTGWNPWTRHSVGRKRARAASMGSASSVETGGDNSMPFNQLTPNQAREMAGVVGQARGAAGGLPPTRQPSLRQRAAGFFMRRSSDMRLNSVGQDSENVSPIGMPAVDRSRDGLIDDPPYLPPSPLNTSESTIAWSMRARRHSAPVNDILTAAPNYDTHSMDGEESRQHPSAGMESVFAFLQQQEERQLQQSGEPPIRWFVSCVNRGTPAALAGVRFGDEIISLEGIDAKLFTPETFKSIFVNKVRESRLRGEDSCSVVVETIANSVGRDLFCAHDPVTGYGFYMHNGKVTKVKAGTNAELAGIRKSDHIIAVNGQCVVGLDDVTIHKLITAPTSPSADYLPPYSVKDMHKAATVTGMRTAPGASDAVDQGPMYIDSPRDGSTASPFVPHNDDSPLGMPSGISKPTLCLSVISEPLYKRLTAFVTEAMLRFNMDHLPPVIPQIAERARNLQLPPLITPPSSRSTTRTSVHGSSSSRNIMERCVDYFRARN